MNLPQFLVCFALVLAGLTLFQLEAVVWRKIGMALIWLASGLAVYFLTGSAWLAGIVLLAWIFFPVWEMVFVLRKLRVPRHRELADARAPREEFEELIAITAELAGLDFRNLDECRFESTQYEQYFRLFSHENGLTQATVGYIARGAIGFHFVALASNGRDGRRWMTWDYPLTYGLVMPPNVAVYRALDCGDAAELYQAHLDFLEVNGVGPDDLVSGGRTAAEVRAEFEQALNQQIEYNISRGYLAPAAERDAESFCYSWRGTLYVAGRVLRDLLF